jgi:hypothetical protein
MAKMASFVVHGPFEMTYENCKGGRSSVKTEELGKLAMASIEKGDVARDKSANLYITASKYLAEPKRSVQEMKVFTWPEWLAKHCPIGRSRANCDFRFNPATDSDLIPATVPI